MIDGSVNTGSKVTILFLSDFPSGPGTTPIFSVYGRADFLFSRSDGSAVSATNQADQFEISLAGAASMNVLDQLSAKFTGSLSLTFSSTGFVVEANALANVSYLGDIGSAAGELHVQKVGGSLEIWGAFLMTANLSSMEQSGIYASGIVFFSLNTTSVMKPLTLTLPATPPATPTVRNLAIKPESFGLLINGQAVVKLPNSSPGDPGLFTITAALVIDVDASGLTVFANGSLTLGAPGADPLLAFTVNGLLVVNSQGVAARLTLMYSNSTIPGVGLDGRFHLVLNTTGQEVSYVIPAVNPVIPTVMGPDPANPFGPAISLETVDGNGVRSLIVPGGPPTLEDSIVSWTPTAANDGEGYVVIFGAGSLTLLDTFTLNGAFRLVVSGSELAMTVDMAVDLADLGSVNATGTLLIDSTGLAGALQLGVQAGTQKSGPGFSLSGTITLLVNTRHAAVPALSLPAGPYVQVGVAGTLAIGLDAGTSFVMVGNFVLTTTAGETAVTASATLTAELGGVTLFSMQSDGVLLMSASGIAARITLGTGGAAGMSGDGFTFTGFFTFEVNTTGQPVSQVNGVTVNLAAGPYVRVLVGGDPAAAGSEATLALGAYSGNSIGMTGSFDLEMSPAGLSVTASAALFVKLGGATLFSLDADGALLITQGGIAAKLTLGTGSSQSTAAQGFSFTGYFTLELNTASEPVTEINGDTVNLGAGPYVRLTIGGEPAVSGSQATLQLAIGGASGFRMVGSFDLELKPSGLAVTATSTLQAVVAGQTLLSVDASGALLITGAGIAAKIDLAADSFTGSFYEFSGTFTLSINTTLAAVPTINAVAVNLPAGPYAYLAVTGAVSLPAAAGLSLSGVFSIAASPAGLQVFADASLAFGPSIAAFTFHALGVLIINGDGAAADFDVSMSVGSALSSVLSAANISARVIFNTTGEDQAVTIPAAFLPLLNQKTRDRLVPSTEVPGLMSYPIAGGAPMLDGTTASPGAYIVARFDATLTLGGFWTLAGHFAFAAGTDFFQLSADASLDLGFLGSVNASGFVQVTSAGIAGSLSVSGNMGTAGFQLSAAAFFEVNTTGADVNTGTSVIETGYRVSFTGTASFLGFCQASATGFVSIDATGLQLYFDGAFAIGPLSFSAKAYVGVFSNGIVLDASVSFKTNILSLFDFDFNGRVQVNTTGAPVAGFNGPDGVFVQFVDAKEHRSPSPLIPSTWTCRGSSRCSASSS